MNSTMGFILRSSILRKQLIAVTGLALVGFVIAHLAGNATFFFGPTAFNDYAHKMQSLGPLLWIMRGGLITVATVHVVFTLALVYENRRARPRRYKRSKAKGDRSWATRTMVYSGLLIVAFLALHLTDFTFAAKDGPRSVIDGVNDDANLELFGLVWTSFKQWWRAGFYVLAMAAVGAHLSHAIQSVFQTFGLNHERYTPWIRRFSVALGVLVAFGFSAIPIYVFLADRPLGA